MHADGVGDGLQIERAQMLHAVDEEPVLLFDDLGRDLEDGLGALIERAHQPGRGLQVLGEIGLGAVGPRVLGELGVIALVDEDLRQRVGVELDDEAAVGARPHIDVGHDRLHRGRAEGQARLRIETADFGDHVGEILVADAADPPQRGEVALGEQIEAADQRLHRRIEAVALPELDARGIR